MRGFAARCARARSRRPSSARSRATRGDRYRPTVAIEGLVPARAWGFKSPLRHSEHMFDPEPRGESSSGTSHGSIPGSSSLGGFTALPVRGASRAIARVPVRHFGDAIPGLTDGILGQCPDRARSTALCSARLPRPSGRDTYVGVFPIPSTSATASGSARRRPASYCSLKAASPSVNDRTRAPT